MKVKAVINTLLVTILIHCQISAQNESKTEILLVGFDHLGQMDNGLLLPIFLVKKSNKKLLK